MVQLVLDDARRERFELEPHRPAPLVLGLDGHPHLALDRHQNSLERQAALVLGRGLLARRHDPRVDEHVGFAVVRLQHAETLEHPDLGGRQPDSVRIRHQCRHPLDQPEEIVVERIDLAGGHPQHGIRVLADLRKREPPPRSLLRVELVIPDLSVFVGQPRKPNDGHTGRSMDRREREAISWEGVPRQDVRRERAEQAATEQVSGSPLAGRPLRRPMRNWRPGVDSYVLSSGGPLPWMLRLRRIEDLTTDHLHRLEEAYVAHVGDPEGWERTAHGWDFYAVNELIDRHNRYYPVETRLPMDPRTRDYVLVNGRPYTRPYLDAGWALERFPTRVLAADGRDQQVE
jgi:hypothetical protein